MTDGPKKIIKDITKGFAKHGYICSEQIATAVYLASELEKPILIEGPPGVGTVSYTHLTLPTILRV